MVRTRAVYLRLTTLAFSSLCGLCIFRVRAHADAPKNSHPLSIGRFVATPLVPVFLSLCCFSPPPPRSPFPPPLVHAFARVFRFGGETMKSLSPTAIASAESAATDARLLLFPLLFPDLYKYIFFFFSICLWFTTERLRFLP